MIDKTKPRESTDYRGKAYSLDEALDLVKKYADAKFDESVDLAIKLNVDPKKSDQNVRGTVLLPHEIGKKKKILVFAKGEKEKEAREAGADEVGTEDLIEKISKGWFDFDIAIATPDMMKDVGKLGKILGPKGLLPNPKIGTVTFEIRKTVNEFKKGKMEYKVDSGSIIHSTIGKVSLPKENLRENTQVLIDAVSKVKPSSVKGEYIKSIYVSSTMGPGIKLYAKEFLKIT